jgi:hypothetical protein
MLKVPSRAAVLPRTADMPLTPFLKDTHFGPDEIAVMVAAYEAVVRELDLTSYSSGAATVAKTIVMLARQGESDPVRLRERAIEIISGGLHSDVA